LASESVAFNLTFAADPEVCVSLVHDSIMGLLEAVVNTNSVEIVLLLIGKGLMCDCATHTARIIMRPERFVL
jgi:hypothetical protein